MRFFATVAVFGAVALASETVQVKEATIHYNGEAPTAADFTIQPANVKCSSSSAADLASDVAVTCGDSPYRFELRNGGNGELAVTIHKQTAPATTIALVSPGPPSSSSSRLRVVTVRTTSSSRPRMMLSPSRSTKEGARISGAVLRK
ncbi:hypothetical protein MPH_12424 [Macrophomina phaseolina MS6]|uniref:AA1-like domain-containing protein n=1 Tax=Macrophomina phaseolina (strain MS6) TaxID=1126212 RepID=K2QLA0_MACPH|nr:hypothetical protein MPH_12424 [Macrophomina phaseolina MS6]